MNVVVRLKNKIRMRTFHDWLCTVYIGFVMAREKEKYLE